MTDHAHCGATAIKLLLIGISDTHKPSDFRRLFRIQLKTGILNAMRSRQIDTVTAEECWRAVSEGGAQ